MRFLRRVIIEVTLVAPRVVRTKLGTLLLLLGVLAVWVHVRGGGLDALTAVLEAGALGAVIASAWMAGTARDRAALATALTHPTTPIAIATGRWLAIVLPAALLATLSTMATGEQPAVAAAGIVTAAAVGAFALTCVLAAGSGAAATLFLLIAVAGAVAPERLVDLAHPGFVRVAAASALELGPALWHYREIATGDWMALLHALAWTLLGILLASSVIARQRAHG